MNTPFNFSDRKISVIQPRRLEEALGAGLYEETREMEGDLLGFAAPPTSQVDENAPAMETVVSGPPQPSPASVEFDLLNGSPIKHPKDLVEMPEEAVEESVPDFAKPPSTDEQDEAAATSKALQKQESINIMDFGGCATDSNEDTHSSVNLLEFGASAADDDVAAIPPPSQGEQVLDLFGEPSLLSAEDPTTLEAPSTIGPSDPFGLGMENAPASLAAQEEMDIFANPNPTTPACSKSVQDPFEPVPSLSTDKPISFNEDAFAQVGAEVAKAAKESSSQGAKQALPTEASAPVSTKEQITSTGKVQHTSFTSTDIPHGETVPTSEDHSQGNTEEKKWSVGIPDNAEETVESTSAVAQAEKSEQASPETPAASTPVRIDLTKVQQHEDDKPDASTENVATSQKALPETPDKLQEAAQPETVDLEFEKKSNNIPTEVNKDDKKKEASVGNATGEALQIESISAKESGGESNSVEDRAGAHEVPESAPPSNATAPSADHEVGGLSPTVVASPDLPELKIKRERERASEFSPTKGTVRPVTQMNGASSKISGKLAEPISATPINSSSFETGSSPARLAKKQLSSTIPLTPDPSKAPENSPETPLPDRLKWLEKELHAAHAIIQQFQHHGKDEDAASDEVLVDLQANLQDQMSWRAEAEDKARLAIAASVAMKKKLKALQEKYKAKSQQLEQDLLTVTKEKKDMEIELVQIREERDEQARKEASLTTRLNAAKKKEAEKSNAAEHYEGQVEFLQTQTEETKKELETTTEERNQHKQEVALWKQYAEQRTKQLESSLAAEKNLNDERKRKMKEFVEAKTEEVRAAKADNLGLQTELDQSNLTLKDLNQRYKQIHAQWLQAQTRNRELQRDMTKMKKDSEKMTKVGGTLEAKLSRSALETEGHKNKRLAAKNELMAMLGQLEAERDVNNRLLESIKVTFTPKALSQQQTIQETLDDLESVLIKLSIKLGKALPHSTVAGNEMLIERTGDNEDYAEESSLRNSAGHPASVSEGNTQKVLSKLENETQRVSQSIFAITNSVERLHSLADGPSTRSCVGAFQSFLMSSQETEETTAMTGASRGGYDRGALT